jgi:LPS-assembly lipoprotein
MSLAETGPARVIMSRQRFVARLSLVRGLALVLALAPMLAACGSGGIRPLYGATPSGAGLQERLAQLDVATIPGRVGQRIRNDLIFQSSGGGELAPPTHRLEITITESVISTLVKTDGDALGQTYALVANFKLVEIKSKQVVLTGSSHGRAGFERFQSIYSNVRARDDAENRAARTVAEDLKTRVAIYLSGQA